MSFLPGVSGNSKGRPKHTAEQQKEKEVFNSLLKAATIDALKGIIDISSDAKNKDRFAACKFLIEKAYGAATVFLSDNELEAITINIVRHSPAGELQNDIDNEDCWD